MSNHRRLYTNLLCLSLCLIPMVLVAGEGKVLQCHLQACIDLAFANHPMLKAGEARQSAARSQVEVKIAERRPSLDLEGESGYLAGEAITPFTALSGVTEEGISQRRVSGGYYQAMVGLQVPLFKEGALLGQTAGSVRQAQLKVAEEDWATQFLRLQVALNVAESYVHVLKQRKAAKIHEDIVALMEASHRLVLAQFRQDLLARNDLLIAEVRLATAKRDLSLTHLDLQKRQKALVASMGLVETIRIVDIQDLQEPPPPLVPLESLVTLARQNHPALKARQLRVQEELEEVSRIRSEQYPSFSFRTQYGFVDAFEGRLNDQWTAAVSVKVPIFDFGLIRKKSEVARAKAMEEERLMLDFQRDMEQQISERHMFLQHLEEQRGLIKKQIEQAQEELKLNQAMFRQQLVPQLTVLTAETALLKLQLALSEAQYDRKLAHIQLSLISGPRDLKTE
jgi:outer membrane protein